MTKKNQGKKKARTETKDKALHLLLLQVRVKLLKKSNHLNYIVVTYYVCFMDNTKVT
jgi:hypothetical protein